MQHAIISYSVAIRTLGNTGEKYKRTILSILAQTVPPEEIIVVIPYGYELDYLCGSERIVRCEKGMVTQRAVGINEVKSEFVLVADDDVELAPDFVEKAFEYLQKWNLDCALPKRPASKLNFGLKSRIKGAIRGTLFVSEDRDSDWLDVIVRTSGHKVYVNSYREDKCYLCQTGCFQLFFMKTGAAQRVKFNEEVWLEQGTLSRYAILDDAVFFYKAYLLGQRIAYAPADYVHLDAAAGRPAKSRVDEKRIRYYSDMRNHYIFWYRFIYCRAGTALERIAARMGWLHFAVGYSLWSAVSCIRPKYWPALSAMARGWSEASHFIKSL